MRQKDIITLVIALGIAFLSALLAKAILEGATSQQAKKVEAAPAPALSTTEVLVAKDNISIGTAIKPNMMMWQKWPKEALLDTYLVRSDMEEDQYQRLVDGLSKREINRGEPITPDDIIKTGDRSFLAAIVAPGMRAVSLPLGPSAAGSSLLSPEDRVDVISANMFSSGGPKATALTGMTLVENAKVLAVDRHLGQHNKPAAGGPLGGPEDSAKFITIEVTPEEAEILSMATKLGELTFSLRGLEKDADKKHGQNNALIRKRLQDQLQKQESTKPQGAMLQMATMETAIMRGGAVESLRFRRGEEEGQETWSLVVSDKNKGADKGSVDPQALMAHLSKKNSAPTANTMKRMPADKPIPPAYEEEPKVPEGLEEAIMNGALDETAGDVAGDAEA